VKYRHELNELADVRSSCAPGALRSSRVNAARQGPPATCAGARRAARASLDAGIALPDFPGALKSCRFLKELEQPLAERPSARRAGSVRAQGRRRGGGSRAHSESEGRAEVRCGSHGHAAQLHVTPLRSAELFRRQMMDHPPPGSSLPPPSPSARTSGISPASSACPSRDAPRAARSTSRAGVLYIPRACRSTRTDPAFTQAVIEAALPVLEASGRARVPALHHARALRRAHEMLAQPHRFSASRTGDGIAQRAAVALPRARQAYSSAASLLGRP